MTERPEHDPHDPRSGADPATDPASDAPIDPATEDAVRALLAEAAGPVATPPEVAARLDAAVADLVAERDDPRTGPLAPAHDPEGVIIRLDPAARARRNRVRLLLGAAAVVVVGAVATGVAGGGGSGEDAMTSFAEDAPVRSEPNADSAGGQAAPESAAGSAGTAEDQRLSAPAAGQIRREVVDGPLRTIRPDRLRADLVALQESVLAPVASLSASQDAAARVDYSGSVLLAPTDVACAPAAFGPGLLVAVLYDGSPAVVALRTPVGSTQETDVLACGTGDVLHSTTLPTVD